MFDLYLEPSCSLEKLTAKMDLLGLRPKWGRPFSRSYIQKMLKNPFYIGKNRWMGVDYDGMQTPIIADDVFIRAQNKMTRKNPPVYNKHNPVFKNMFVCEQCAGAITWELQKDNWYGHCNRYRGCPKKKWIREDKVETELLSLFEKLVCPSPAIIDWVTTALRARHQNSMDAHNASVKQLRQEIDALDRKDNLMYEDRLALRITLDTYEIKHKENLLRKKDLEKSLKEIDEKAERQFEHGMDILTLSQEAATVYQKKNPEQKRVILSKLFSNLSVNCPELRFDFTELAMAIAEKLELTKNEIKKFELAEKTGSNRDRHELTESLRTLWLELWSDFRTLTLTIDPKSMARLKVLLA